MVAVGEIWEGHELVSELERGMVRTFLARQVGDTRELVWLHLREGAGIEKALFTAEIERLQRLSDKVPQIVRVRYGGIAGGVAWAASSFQKDAIRLKDAVRGADLGLTALNMLAELGRYLVDAHELGSVHGSLSPERVLITAGNGYAFTHFGFARLFRLGGDEAVREPRYAAPELIFGERLGKRTDVYGLGTIMYELLCRRELYSDADPEPQAASAKVWEPRFPITVPSVLRFAMRRALAKDPKDRYTSVEEMVAVLLSLADEGEALWRTPEPSDDALTMTSASPRRARGEREVLLVDDDWEPFASDEPEGSAVEPPSPLSPASAERNSSGRSPRSDVVSSNVPPLDALAPPESEAPDLDPVPPRPPTPPTPRIAARSNDGGARRRLVRLFGQVLALASMLVLGAASMLLWWRRVPPPMAHLPPAVRVVASSLGTPPLRGSSDVPEAPFRAVPPVVPEQPTGIRPAAFTRQTAETPMPAGIQAQCDGPYIHDGDTGF